ncbi:hypothetical protein CHS0354_018399 [Potamilus streckersoni]|uniref:Biotin transporter n=1 Tax=Potamilus streckersoni TaxID=2493646 RepID=A0AAE0TBH7_9BIVA|nr:hypothetical protein CHS0354_018399 [Potamilus streckersoni]
MTTQPSALLVSGIERKLNLTQAPSVLRLLVQALAGSLLIALSAQIEIPFFPVPFTGQTFAPCGNSGSDHVPFGGRNGTARICGGAAGIAQLMGPTGGYLAGFIPAAYICGRLADKGYESRLVPTALGFLAGSICIYALGVAWLGTVIGWDKPVLEFGLYPFIPGDLLKMALVSALLPALKKISR